MKKKAVWTLGVLVLSAGLAAGQEKPTASKKPAPAAPVAKSAAAGDHAATEKAIVANENKVLAALSKQDKAGFSALMGPGSIAADETGFMKVDDFVSMIDQLKMSAYKISDSKFLWVDPSTVVHYFTWTGTGSFQGQPFKSPTYASTVWTKKGGTWLAVFHQESIAAAPAKK
jgi:hypothetical protein